MYSHSKLGGKYLLADIEKTDKAYHSELQRMYKNLRCDCGSRHTNWATLRRGEERFVCINCAQSLRADSQNKIKSAMGTYRWHPDEMTAIRTRYSATTRGATKVEENELQIAAKEEEASSSKRTSQTKKKIKTKTKTAVDNDDDPFGFFSSFLEQPKPAADQWSR